MAPFAAAPPDRTSCIAAFVKDTTLRSFFHCRDHPLVDGLLEWFTIGRSPEVEPTVRGLERPSDRKNQSRLLTDRAPPLKR